MLAVLAGVTTGAEARDLVGRVLADKTLTKCSDDFRHYLHSAVNAVGEGDRYLDLLGEWESMLSRGLTTFAERYERPGDPSRSDCHAWSASPNFESFRTVLGIDTAAPGFSRVEDRLFPGKLERGSRDRSPHPKGEISVEARESRERHARRDRLASRGVWRVLVAWLGAPAGARPECVHRGLEPRAF